MIVSASLPSFVLMRNFIDEKHFGAACTGTVTVAICYVAGMNDWRLIALLLLVVLAYYLTFQNRA
jgi:hypothetical protein